MTTAKDLRVAPIAPKDAHDFVRARHYSGKSVNNSQLHLGAFLGRRLVGVAQLGPPMDRGKLIGLVRDTAWNDMLELNRLVMVDDTPRNSESRFLAMGFRLMRQYAPHVEWVVSFADATQCGDGTIYRAAGFVLTGIKRNNQVWEMPSGETGDRLTATNTTRPAWGRLLSRTSMTANGPKGASAQKREILARMTVTKGSHTGQANGSASMAPFIAMGARPLPGFQLRYIYFIDPTASARLTVPIIPFSKIAEMGAGMYLGQPRAGSIVVDAPAVLAGEGGSVPTPALHTKVSRW